RAGRGRARPRCRYCACGRTRAAGRRRPHRREGCGAGPGVRRPDSSVRRPRGCEGGARVIPLTLDEVRDLAPGRLEGTAETITGVQVDSRRIEPGDLFVVVSRGEVFLDDARARGAAATLVPDDAHAALAALGGAVRDQSDAQVVGITGSVGKTSTKDILAA